MQFGTWDAFFNLIFLFFWFTVWNLNDRNVLFNPILAAVNRMSVAAIDFLRPVFFTLPARLIALVALIFLLVLRGIAVPRDALWIMRLGFEIRQPNMDSVTSCVAMSILSFGIFLFKLWGLSLIYVHGRRQSLNHSSATVSHLSRPFTDLRVDLRPLALLAVGMVLALALSLAGQPVPGLRLSGLTDPGLSHPITRVLQFGISALRGWVDVLALLRSFLILLIIGSWVSLFTGSHAMMGFCREWMDFLLGPLRRYPIRIGMFDLTPIVFVLVVGFLHWLLHVVLALGYRGLLPTTP